MEKPLHPSWTGYALSCLRIKSLFVATFLFFFSFNYSNAQSLPSGFSQVLVANGISNPTVMAFAPDGRIFVAQQNGQLRVIKNGSLLSQPFISLSVSSSGERGLLGIAFDPNFSSNNYIYLYYTVSSGQYNRISRFTASGDVAVSGSEQVILNLDPLSGATNHNGGTMQFGPDGKLYVGVGENADASYSQRTDTYHGKILRINPDGSVPSGNPFTDGNEQRRRIWAWGVRNPYTIAFQPGTGRLFVNDVGASSWEEINDATTGGKNFGWPNEEGWGNNFSGPIYAYGHGGGVGNGCAITGGTFFNPSSTNYPSTYYGRYFYLDYCNNWIDMLTINGGSASRSNFASNIAGSALSLTTGPDGSLYFLSRDNSAVYKIAYAGGSSAPVITSQPQNITVAAGNNATFRVTANGSSLSYQWRKNGNNINGANSSSYTINSADEDDEGNYSVVVSNSSGSVTSNSASLTVTSANQPPTASIATPAAGSTYAGGSVINFSGNATDPENGNLGSGAYSWYVIFHHDSHTHPGPSTVTNGNVGSFTIPNSGETSANVFYRLYLVVTDAQGARDTAYRDIMPRTSTITLNTNPQGLTVTLDGQPFTAPLTVTSVEGIVRSIGTNSPQNNYTFSGWSHGGNQTQNITTPADNITYTANFNSAVVITQQPQSVTVEEGESVTFRVTATGSGTLSYQWRRNGSNISGANSSSYSIGSVNSGHAGNYSVVVTNASGSVTSNNATLTVTSAPVITTQPQSQTVAQGNNVTFSVVAGGTAPLSYQWRRNGNNISGATGASYSISSVNASHAGNYSVVVSNSSGSVVSNNATLTVTTAPVITGQPQNATVSEGGNASFNVTATGTAPLRYQWRRNGNNINGATGSTYTITSVTASQAGTYSVIVSNDYGSVTSNGASLTVTSAPVITAQPQSQTVTQGSSATFTVTASGSGPLSYQWRRNGNNIPGANASSYTIASVSSSNAGNYAVVVSNGAGTVLSSTATLTVTTSPVITTQPQSATVTEGQPVSFSVTAAGTAPLRYQWRRNGVVISGATAATYTISAVTASQAGNYSVAVTNDYGTATSNAATLTVRVPSNEAPVATITSPALGTTYVAGTTINFSGTASDPEDGTPDDEAYEWYVLFYHASHSHEGPVVSSNGPNGSFDIPNTGETAVDVFYRLHLVVTDRDGNKDTTYRDIYPRTSVITLNSNPQGMNLSVDGEIVSTPYVLTSVEGVIRSITAISPQNNNGVFYNFMSWSNAGSQAQAFTTPAGDVDLTVNFVADTTPGVALRNPDNPVNPVNGLDYAYYHGTWSELPDFGTWRKEKAGTVNNFNLSPRTENDNFGLRFTGYVQVPVDGNYTFYVSSDEGSRLYIGDSLIVDNNGLHAVQERSGEIGLKAGLHYIMVEYFDRSLQQELTVSYEGPAISKQAIPDSVLYREMGLLYVLNPYADAHVQTGNYNNVNMGAAPVITAGNADNRHEIYLRFDIASLRTGISSAKLRLYGGLTGNPGPATVNVHNVTSQSWLERTITNNNKPSAGQEILASSIVYGGAQQYYEWDLTSHINSLRSSGQLYVSLLVKVPSNSPGLIEFNARENAVNGPQLAITYDEPAVTATRAAAPSLTKNITIAEDVNQLGSCFTIYPNPVRDKFTISYSTALKNRKLQITDINGRLIRELNLTGGNTQQVSTDGLREGIYFLSMQSGKTRCTQKLVIGR